MSSASSPRAAEALAPSLLLPLVRFPRWRRLLATLGFLVPLGTVAHAVLAEGRSVGDAVVVVELLLLGLAGFALHFDRVVPQLFVRAELWSVLGLTSVGLAVHFDPTALAVLGSAAVALLALGNAGLDSSAGSFAPRALRGTLLTMMFFAGGVAHCMGLVLYMYQPDLPVLVTALASLAPVLALVGVAGLVRTRSWGLFAYLGAIGAALGTAALIRFEPSVLEGAYVDGRPLVFGWTLGGVALFAVGLPVFAALVARRRPAGPSPWGGRLHAAAVLATAAFPGVVHLL